VDDFDITDGEAVLDPKDNEDNLRKIANRIQTYKAKEINPPRPGKKLLVLDIDYTLFDHRSTAEKPLELMRPFLHDFLVRRVP
jgi:ubiquitin-like domain-containing CTD phosphatase 1